MACGNCLLIAHMVKKLIIKLIKQLLLTELEFLSSKI